MFLKAVYRHSKLLCAAILLFFLLQVAVDYKRGLVFAPFFHYGMYSKPQHLSDTLVAWITLHGNDTLKGHQFSPAHWDRLTYVPARIEKWGCRHWFFETTVEPLLQRAGLNKGAGTSLVQMGSTVKALQQYASRQQRYFKLHDTLTVQKHLYVWNGAQLVRVINSKPAENKCR